MKNLLKYLLVFGITFLILFVIVKVVKEDDSILKRAKRDLTEPKMIPIGYAIISYKTDTGQRPDKLTDLLLAPKGFESTWKGPYLKPIQLIDPWGNQYVYEPNSLYSQEYDLKSYGANGKPGGKGYNADIVLTNNDVDDYFQKELKSKMVNIEKAIDLYFKYFGRYPNSLEDLLAVSEKPELYPISRYINGGRLLDPWNNKYIYEPNNLNPKGYDLKSYGTDGKPGGEGYDKDIYNE